MDTSAFPGLVDLACEKVNGRALAASDEFFAPKENLLKPGRGVFIADEYTDRGKWMDGWETRRKREAGHDWCIVRLGLPGIIRGVDIDTNHFLGNHPLYASLEVCNSEGDPTDDTRWTEILPMSPLRPGSQNPFAIADSECWTHVRLNIYPDGGVARLRVFGIVVPDWERLKAQKPVDLASIANGGTVPYCSDMFFSPKENLIMPRPPVNMGDGWETRRRRIPGHDWAIVQLGAPGTVEKVVVDTSFFKGNYPDRCSLLGCRLPQGAITAPLSPQARWHEMLPPTKLQADTVHTFELNQIGVVSHVRLDIYPDGGVARLRLFGSAAGKSCSTDEQMFQQAFTEYFAIA